MRITKRFAVAMLLVLGLAVPPTVTAGADPPAVRDDAAAQTPQARPRAGKPPASKPEAKPRQPPAKPREPQAKPRQRQPPAPKAAPAPPRRPPSPPVARPRPPRAVPRPPRSGHPPTVRTYVYPVPYPYPYPSGFEFMVGPYGTYWYWGYYPYAPYSYLVVGPTYAEVDEYAPGQLRLDVTPADAEVYVDGYYAGVVEDFDGLLQTLALVPGPHHVEICRDGYQPAAIDVDVQPGQTIRYRAALLPLPRP